MKIPKIFFIGFSIGIIAIVGLATALKQPLFLQSSDLSAEEDAFKGAHASRGPEDAPITIVEFADFQCPFCTKAEQVMRKLMENYPGKIKIVFRHYPLSLDPDQGSLPVHHGSLCAREQQKFWEFHDHVFSSSSRIEKKDLGRVASDIGLDSVAFESCMNTGRYFEYLLRERRDGASKGVSGTPAFFVNEHQVRGAFPYDYFEQLMDAILEPENYDLPPGLEPEVDEKLSVDFENLEGRPSMGPADAPVTMIEFSDYHCPFCRKLMPTLNKLIEQYGDKIHRVFRHFPLDMHTGARKAHEAAECAHDQEKFWPYHQGLMSSPKIMREQSEFVALAGGLGLNVENFKACLESGRHQEFIESEIRAGMAAGVRGTPAVFINGNLISGAQPYSVFDGEIKKALQQT